MNDVDIRNLEFILCIRSGSNNITATFHFLERFEKLEYNSMSYYSASFIKVTNCSEASIKTSVDNYDIRKLYKDVYEKLGLTSSTRPPFDLCVMRASDKVLIANI